MVFRRLYKIFIRIKYYFRNITNRILYGPGAPRYGEIIWINPDECNFYITDDSLEVITGERRKLDSSGKVITTKWPVEEVKPIEDIPKIRYCYAHWANNVPWENTGIFELHLKNFIIQEKLKSGNKYYYRFRCNDILERYTKLDHIYEQVKKEGRFRLENEVDPKYNRKNADILVHIGPNGEIYFGIKGQHRFAMAKVLNLQKIPVMLGCIHISALPHLNILRQENQ